MNRALKSLLWILGLISAVGFGISGASIYVTSRDAGFFAKPICLNAECLRYWGEELSIPLSYAKSTFDVLVAVATVGGVVVALMTYFATVRTAAITTHISHLDLFQKFLESEITRRPRVSKSSVDCLFWYNSIFSTSRSGRMDIFEDYSKLVLELAAVLSASNARSQRGEDGTFRFKEHQRQMIEVLAKFGIRIDYQPRIEFFEIEGQLLSLVSCVNESFCFGSEVPKLPRRDYR